jgi:hypothetical protein
MTCCFLFICCGFIYFKNKKEIVRSPFVGYYLLFTKLKQVIIFLLNIHKRKMADEIIVLNPVSGRTGKVSYVNKQIEDSNKKNNTKFEYKYAKDGSLVSLNGVPAPGLSYTWDKKAKTAVINAPSTRALSPPTRAISPPKPVPMNIPVPMEVEEEKQPETSPKKKKKSKKNKSPKSPKSPKSDGSSTSLKKKKKSKKTEKKTKKPKTENPKSPKSPKSNPKPVVFEETELEEPEETGIINTTNIAITGKKPDLMAVIQSVSAGSTNPDDYINELLRVAVPNSLKDCVMKSMSQNDINSLEEEIAILTNKVEVNPVELSLRNNKSPEYNPIVSPMSGGRATGASVVQSTRPVIRPMNALSPKGNNPLQGLSQNNRKAAIIKKLKDLKTQSEYYTEQMRSNPSNKDIMTMFQKLTIDKAKQLENLKKVTSDDEYDELELEYSFGVGQNKTKRNRKGLRSSKKSLFGKKNKRSVKKTKKNKRSAKKNTKKNANKKIRTSRRSLKKYAFGSKQGSGYTLEGLPSAPSYPPAQGFIFPQPKDLPNLRGLQLFGKKLQRFLSKEKLIKGPGKRQSNKRSSKKRSSKKLRFGVPGPVGGPGGPAAGPRPGAPGPFRGF